MIKIKKDMSYLSETDLKAIENGIAELTVHSINLDRYFTEREKENNVAKARQLLEDQKAKYYEEQTKKFASKMEFITSELEKVFTFYNGEIETHSSTKWDLYFWSNPQKDYVKLNPNKRKEVLNQNEDILNAISILEKLEVENVSATVQYSAKYNDKKVKEIVSSLCKKHVNKFINYKGYIGKIVVFGQDENGNSKYAFRKKGAKTKHYEIDPMGLLYLYFIDLEEEKISWEHTHYTELMN